VTFAGNPRKRFVSSPKCFLGTSLARIPIADRMSLLNGHTNELRRVVQTALELCLSKMTKEESKRTAKPHVNALLSATRLMRQHEPNIENNFHYASRCYTRLSRIRMIGQWLCAIFRIGLGLSRKSIILQGSKSLFTLALENARGYWRRQRTRDHGWRLESKVLRHSDAHSSAHRLRKDENTGGRDAGDLYENTMRVVLAIADPYVVVLPLYSFKRLIDYKPPTCPEKNDSRNHH
jgi:hypothetical protein